MSMASCKSRLTSATRDLALHWDDTKNSWRDAKGREFEQHYLLPLFSEVDQTVKAVEKLDELLRQVRSGCE